AAGAVVIIGVLAGIVGWRRRRRTRRAEARQAKLDRVFGVGAEGGAPDESAESTAPSPSAGPS
ncbi:MAG: hypothetical protein ABI276_01135, partial [Acidimicrobiales bacterium]